MSKVFLLDSERKPLDPIHPGWARRLLSSGQAAVLRRYPFTLILKKTIEVPAVQELRIKLDPGSRTTGIAILNDGSGEVVFAAELTHRGQQIKKALDGVTRPAWARVRQRPSSPKGSTRCSSPPTDTGAARFV
jgi:hypothetical protein